jgi:hypothetical protein
MHSLTCPSGGRMVYSFLKDLFFLITLYFPWFSPAAYHLLYTLVERQPPLFPYYQLAI